MCWCRCKKKVEQRVIVIDMNDRIYALRHLESGDFICLLQDGVDHLASFANPDDAADFRKALGLIEHVDIVTFTFKSSPFTHLWYDGRNVGIQK